MKRTLPLIVILITLSLLGLIWLQASWLENILEVGEVQLFHKVSDAGTSVANDLSKSVHNSPSLNITRKPGFRFGFDLSKLAKPPSIAVVTSAFKCGSVSVPPIFTIFVLP